MEQAVKIAGKWGILINPEAGAVGDAQVLQNKIASLFQRARLQACFHISTPKENLLEAAHQMARAKCQGLAVAGGDGSIHQILPALVKHALPLGVFPMGSVNLLALEMGIPKDIAAAVRIIQAGNARVIDAGIANGRYFFQVLGNGLDAHILWYMKTRWKKKWRALVLPFAGMKAWAENRAHRWRICYDGKIIERIGSGIIVANGAMYGGPFRLAPDVANDDGVLDLFILPKIPISALVRFCIGVLSSLPVHTDMEHFRASHFSVACEPPAQDIPGHVDGELGLNLPLEIQAVPRAISVLAP